MRSLGKLKSNKNTEKKGQHSLLRGVPVSSACVLSSCWGSGTPAGISSSQADVQSAVIKGLVPAESSDLPCSLETPVLDHCRLFKSGHSTGRNT